MGHSSKPTRPWVAREGSAQDTALGCREAGNCTLRSIDDEGAREPPWFGQGGRRAPWPGTSNMITVISFQGVLASAVLRHGGSHPSFGAPNFSFSCLKRFAVCISIGWCTRAKGLLLAIGFLPRNTSLPIRAVLAYPLAGGLQIEGIQTAPAPDEDALLKAVSACISRRLHPQPSALLTKRQRRAEEMSLGGGRGHRPGQRLESFVSWLALSGRSN